MQRFRSFVLIAAFAGGAMLALFQLFQRAPARARVKQQHGRTWHRAKRWTFRIAGFFALAAVAGSLVVISGIMPIKASSGHWVITAWFLNFAMRRSVVTHSLGTEVPALADAGLVAKGGTHYDFGCRPCHGGPSIPQPAIAQRMTPAPPHLPRVISQWQTQELFYIVKHGVKFTGMPAWPSQQRDDEVWAMVAFLRELPQLTPQQYYELVRGTSDSGAAINELSGPNDRPQAVSESCARCHGRDGTGRGLGVFPILAGQRPTYLFASLLAYARGERLSGIMQPVAAGLSREAMAELARYYANFAGGLTDKSPNPKSKIENPKLLEAIDRGREIAMHGIPGQRLPACATCHGPSSTPRNPIYPQLAGQYAEYLALQLTLFQEASRGGTPYAHIMAMVARRLTPQQIHDVTHYYASLTANTETAARVRSARDSSAMREP
jgi:cytochrome c553